MDKPKQKNYGFTQENKWKGNYDKYKQYKKDVEQYKKEISYGSIKEYFEYCDKCWI